MNQPLVTSLILLAVLIVSMLIVWLFLRTHRLTSKTVVLYKGHKAMIPKGDSLHLVSVLGWDRITITNTDGYHYQIKAAGANGEEELKFELNIDELFEVDVLGTYHLELDLVPTTTPKLAVSWPRFFLRVI